MRILIAGAGRLGTQIARVLASSRNELTVIELDEQRLAELGEHVSARLLVGDACEPSILEEAGAHATDLLIAATGDDEDNLVISLLGKRQFAIARVIARVNDPDNGWLFDARWGVDVPIPAETPLISLIEEATGDNDTVALLRLSKAGVNVIETTIAASSRSAGRPLAELDLPAGTVVAAVIRGGRPTVPGPTWRLAADDEVLVVTESATADDVRAAFQ